MTQLIQRLLSKPEAQRLVDAIHAGAADIREKLFLLQSGEGWKPLGYKTWDACVESEFSFGRRRANQLLVAAAIEKRIWPLKAHTHGEQLFPLRESHARELAAVPENHQLEVCRRALETSPNGLTAKHIAHTIAAMNIRKLKNIFDDGADGPTMRRHKSNQAHETPWELISAIEKRFGLIGIDLAATKQNAKAGRFISKKEDSLKQDWATLIPKGTIGYLNSEFDPVTPWIDKSIEQQIRDARFVDLLQGSMDANWFWKMLRHCLVYALEPRVTFLGEKDVFPKPLVLSAFNCSHNNEPGKTIERIPGKFHGLYRWHWKLDANQ